MRSVGSISQDLCEMQRVHDHNIQLRAKDLEWQRRIVGAAAAAAAAAAAGTSAVPTPPPPPTDPSLSFTLPSQPTNTLSNTTSTNNNRNSNSISNVFPSNSNTPPQKQLPPNTPASNVNNNDHNNTTTNTTNNTANANNNSNIDTKTENNINEDYYNNQNDYVDVDLKDYDGDVDGDHMEDEEEHDDDDISPNFVSNNAISLNNHDASSPLSPESEPSSSTTHTGSPGMSPIGNAQINTANMVVDTQPTVRLTTSSSTTSNPPVSMKGKAKGRKSNKRSMSSASTGSVERSRFNDDENKSFMSLQQVSKLSRSVGKIRRHRMTKEEEARFNPADLVDLSGSTAAKSRKMTDAERDIMLHKRRLRNRASAARSRDKQRKTIHDLSDEMDDLMEHSKSLLQRCMAAESKIIQLKDVNDVLLKENTYLKQNSLMLSPSPSASTAAIPPLPPQILTSSNTPQRHARSSSQAVAVEKQGSNGRPGVPPSVPESACAPASVPAVNNQVAQVNPSSLTGTSNNTNAQVHASNHHNQSQQLTAQQQVQVQHQLAQSSQQGTPSTGIRRTGSLLRVSMSSDMLDKIMTITGDGLSNNSNYNNYNSNMIMNSGNNLNLNTSHSTSNAGNAASHNNSNSNINSNNIISNSNNSNTNNSLVRIPSKLHVSLSADKLQQDGTGNFPPLSRNMSVMERLLELTNSNGSFDINCDVHVRE